jgi:single-stranded-DNA-specific exonuclease
MRTRNNLGLAALADIAKVDNLPEAYHLGYMMGPRINAGGRVGKSDLGAILLATEDVDEAHNIALELDKLNSERRAIELMVMESALSQIESNGADGPVLFASGKGWHPGVVGIVASRITERFHRPTAIISINNGVGKASARSIPGIDFGSAIVAANQDGLLLAGGGHAMAAGFTIAEEKISIIYDYLCKRFSQNIDEHATKQFKVDSYLSLDALTLDLGRLIKKVEPFGTSNSEPRFIFKDVFVIYADVVGADHIKCILGTDNSGGVGKTVKAMCFRSLETPVGRALLSGIGKRISIAARIKLNHWQGVEKVELVIDDVATN